MSQNAVAPADGTGAVYEANVAAALDTAFSKSSGSGPPAELIGNRDWADTATGKLKTYNSAGAAWVDTGYLNAPFMGNIRPLGNGGQTSYENLSVTANGANSVLLSATDILVTDTATPIRAWRIGAVALTVGLNVSGLNGLDTGSSVTGTMYHLWAIYNPATNTAGAVMSVAYPGSGSVTMPSGYTAKGYIGPIGQALASSVVPDQSMSGDTVIMGTTATVSLTVGADVSYAVSNWLLPPNARAASFSLIVSSSSGTNFFFYNCSMPTPFSAALKQINTASGTVASSLPFRTQIIVPLRPGATPRMSSTGTNVAMTLTGSSYTI